MDAQKFLKAKRALARHERNDWAVSAEQARARIIERQAAGDYDHNHRRVTSWGSELRTGEQVRQSDEFWLRTCEECAARRPRQVMALRSVDALFRYLKRTACCGDEDCQDILDGEGARAVIAALME